MVANSGITLKFKFSVIFYSMKLLLGWDEDIEPPGILGGEGSHIPSIQNAPKSQGNPRDEGSNFQMDDEQEWSVQGGRRRGKRSTVKSQESTSDPKSPPTRTDAPVQNPTQFSKPVTKATRLYLWNAGGKRKQLPSDIIQSNIVKIDKISIYAQILTSDEARTYNVIGWDDVLADIVGLKADVTER